jgi:hypothetical protein
MPGFPSQVGPVLDYASPRVRGKIRLPSKSRVEMTLERDEVIVHEWLQAKIAPLIAITIAAFTLLILPATFIEQFFTYRRMYLGDPVGTALTAAMVLGVFVSETVLMLLVINNTWRRTTLEARRDSLLLQFTSPFKQQRYEWGASDVEDIRLEITTKESDLNRLGEIEIHIAAQPVAKLFTDHAALELEPIINALRRAIGCSPADGH